MNLIHRWKRPLALVLSGILLATACGCGQNKTELSSEINSTQEESNIGSFRLKEYVKPSVKLPEHFEKMIYPMEALAVEYYIQGLPYYTDGKDEDSFWFSMAVLSSLLTENELTDPEYDDEFYYYDREDIDEYASALYYDYLKGTISLPEIDDDNPYASYDEESQRYGLLYGSVGDLSICITGCEANGQGGYDVTYQLISMENNEVLAEYQVGVILPQGQKKREFFFYSISDFGLMDDGIDMEEAPIAATNDPAAEKDYDVVDGQVVTDDSDYYFMDGGELNDQLVISQTEALNLAKSYIGDDASFNYKQLVTIGDYQYYDFGIKNSHKKATDVLVCINGLDVVSGVQNEDGSWSFDQ